MKFRTKDQLAIFNPVPKKFCPMIDNSKSLPMKNKKFLNTL